MNIYASYSFLIFKNNDHLTKTVLGFFKALEHTEPGVKLQAAICMKHLIKKDTIKTVVKPYVAIVVDFILKLMNE